MSENKKTKLNYKVEIQPKEYEPGNTQIEGPEDFDYSEKAKNDKTPKKKKRKFLDQYCNNLTLRAREGKLDTVVGRDRDLDRMLQILSRRS